MTTMHMGDDLYRRILHRWRELEDRRPRIYHYLELIEREELREQLEAAELEYWQERRAGEQRQSGQDAC